MRILLILLVLLLLLTTVMVCDCHRFVVREYTFSSQKLTKDLTLVLLSDLHSVSFGADNRRLLDEIDRAEPDGILIAGDMYTSHTKEDGKTALSLLAALCARYPVWYANGNHEQKTKEEPGEFGTLYTDYAKQLRALGATLLENDAMELPSLGLKIYGLELPFRYYRKFQRLHPSVSELTKLIGKPSDTLCNLLIAHNPEYFADYAAWGAELTVSGHIHGGLMRLPLLGGVVSPKMTLFPKYSGGRYRIRDAVMVLSCGLGTHTLPIRIFNPGELSVIHLHRS